MAILPPAYDNLESVVQASRMMLNDMIAAAGGEVLTDDQPFTLTAVNNAWRAMQEFLAKLGFLRFKNDVYLAELPAVAIPDPTVKPFLDWSGYNNGTSLTDAIVLPQDFIAPIELKERISGFSLTPFTEMDFIRSGRLPQVVQGPWNRIWTWRNEQILLPGATSILDMWMHYHSFAVDFVDAATTPFASQIVPIMRCQDSFSAYLAAEISGPRGDADTKSLIANGEDAARILVGRENPSVMNPPPEAANG
jgi:hypothetical protein